MPLPHAMKATAPQKLNKKEKKKGKKEKKEKQEQEQAQPQAQEEKQSGSGSGSGSSLSKEAKQLLVAMFQATRGRNAEFDRDMEWLIRAGLATREIGPDGEELFGMTPKGVELAEVYEEIAMKWAVGIMRHLRSPAPVLC